MHSPTYSNHRIKCIKTLRSLTPPAYIKDKTKDLVRLQKAFRQEERLQIPLKVALAPTQLYSILDLEPMFT